MKKRTLISVLTAITTGASAIIVFDQDPNPNIYPPPEFGQWPTVKWQLCQGTPIDPFHFITAKHVGGLIGGSAISHDAATIWKTVSVTYHPTADLAIWGVDIPFAEWFDVYRGADELGQTAWMFGRGAQKGVPLYGPDGGLDGWKWGKWDGATRWGLNTIDDLDQHWLWTDFDPEPGQCILMGGDSGGPLFIRDDDQWLLAGVNVAVDGGYSLDPGLPADLHAILFDPENWYLDGEPAPGPSRSWSYRLSNYADWIDSVVGTSPSIPEPIQTTAYMIAMMLFVARKCLRKLK